MGHAKLGQIGAEGDTRIVLTGLACGDDRLLLGVHVVMEALAVLARALAVAGLDDELCREDVGQLGSIAVAAACDL